MSKPILAIQQVTVRNADKTLFNNLSFDIQAGQHWALIGPAGVGKSALLQTINGKFNVTGGSITHHYFNTIKSAHTLPPGFTYHQLLALVQPRHGFRNLSNTSDFYYQQRFNSSDAEDAPTVSEYLSGIHPAINQFNQWDFDTTVSKLKLEPLLYKQVIKLSNGETKRLLMAAALLKQPSLLLLDNPLTGLDASSRAWFNGLLAEIVQSGITIVMATAAHEVPPVITHVAVLNNSIITHSMAAENFNADLVEVLPAPRIDKAALGALLSKRPLQHFTDVVKMENVNITYGSNHVLQNINWHIKQGERWALLGPNGAGKSTLLSLINGDNPQAYANNIILFDRKRGTGESIWDIKSKTGFVSPELHQYFPTDNNCLQVIESGFYDTLGLFKQSNPANAATALQWMQLLELQAYTHKPLKSLPASAQRLCLLARALVKNPPLLIFDEPCQGLDEHQQLHFKHVVDAVCELSTVTMIYVTHYQHQIPDKVNLTLQLNNGVVVGNTAD